MKFGAGMMLLEGSKMPQASHWCEVSITSREEMLHGEDESGAAPETQPHSTWAQQQR